MINFTQICPSALTEDVHIMIVAKVAPGGVEPGPGSVEGSGELRLAATRLIPITATRLSTTSRVDRERRGD